MEDKGIEYVVPYVRESFGKNPKGERVDYDVLEDTRRDVSNRRIRRLANRLIINADYTHAAHQHESEPSGEILLRNLLKGTGLVVAAMAGIATFVYLTVPDAPEERSSFTQARVAVMQNPEALRALGLCQSELLSEAALIAGTQVEDNPNTRLVSDDYYAAAKVAASSSIPCSAPEPASFKWSKDSTTYTFTQQHFVRDSLAVTTYHAIG
jgi:hypothetical protein